MTEAKRMMQYDANKKQVLVAYLFWFFLGMLGGHRFYIGLKGSGTAILLLTVLAVFLTAAGGLLLIIIPAVWVLVDAILIPGMIQRHNNELARSLEEEREPADWK